MGTLEKIFPETKRFFMVHDEMSESGQQDAFQKKNFKSWVIFQGKRFFLNGNRFLPEISTFQSFPCRNFFSQTFSFRNQ